LEPKLKTFRDYATFKGDSDYQINYVSRNQLNYTANLNFGLMCKKTKHCWVLSTNFSIQFS
jgi:hypothetical protein